MDNQYLFSDAEERLIFTPKPWTKGTLKMCSIQEEELKERVELENRLPSLQNIWQKKALKNLQEDKKLWQNTLQNKKVTTYIFKAVKEATLEALSGILHRRSEKETEEFIEWALMTPNDERPFRFVRMEEDTESIYSFQNLMRGRELPEDRYIAKITDVSLQIIEDESDRNYARKLYIFEAEIAEGKFTGRIIKIPFVIDPAYLDVRMGGETEESRQLRAKEYATEFLKTLRNLGVVITEVNSMVAQLPRTVGNMVEVSISKRNRASVDNLIERVNSYETMLEFNDLPDGNDFPI